jgi:putative nucleotidyltransferase with HDIG domain
MIRVHAHRPRQLPGKAPISKQVVRMSDASTVEKKPVERKPVESTRSKEITGLPLAHLRLPPFPQVAIRLLQLANDENVQLHQLSDLISSDPAFATEVLLIANSLLYAPRTPVNSILQAIAVMGANQLQGMCLTVGVRAYLGKSMSHPAMRDLWRHNLACALIAEQLASAGFMDKDLAFTSGILHDIGRFALAAIKPDEYATLLQTYCGSADNILEIERELFGWDHCDLGRVLVVDWKLPLEFEAIAAGHHAPRRADGVWGMAELIKVSCGMADTAGYTAFPGCEVKPYADLLDELPARERGGFFVDIEALATTVANRIQAVESI